MDIQIETKFIRQSYHGVVKVELIVYKNEDPFKENPVFQVVTHQVGFVKLDREGYYFPEEYDSEEFIKIAKVVYEIFKLKFDEVIMEGLNWLSAKDEKKYTITKRFQLLQHIGDF